MISQKLAAAVIQDLRTIYRINKGLPPSLVELGCILKEYVLTPEGMRDSAPYEVESETSKEAAAKLTAKRRTETMERIFSFIQSKGREGAICDECEVALDLDHQTCSARIKDLRDRGDIVFAGRKRKTRTNSSAQVYVLRNLL